jgi:hypothetical protein
MGTSFGDFRRILAASLSCLALIVNGLVQGRGESQESHRDMVSTRRLYIGDSASSYNRVLLYSLLAQKVLQRAICSTCRIYGRTIRSPSFGSGVAARLNDYAG